jgi:hypothetical protein
MSNWKDAATEKHLDKKLGSHTPSCNVRMREFHPVSTQVTGAVESNVAVQECLKKDPAVQTNLGAKLVHEQV